MALATLFIFLFGLVTFGLGWPLFWLLHPAAIMWALLYYGFTLGSPASATIGMRIMDIQLRTWYGAPCYFVLGAVHALAVLGQRLRADAAGSDRRPVQHAAAASARFRSRHGGD